MNWFEKLAFNIFLKRFSGKIKYKKEDFKMGKRFWLSKTFWVNVIAIAALILQSYTGFIMDPEKQVALLGVINIFLRFITKEPVVWIDKEGRVSLRTVFVVFLTGLLLFSALPAFAEDTPTEAPSIAVEQYVPDSTDAFQRDLNSTPPVPDKMKIFEGKFALESTNYLLFGGGDPKLAAGGAFVFGEMFDKRLKVRFAYASEILADTKRDYAGPDFTVPILRLLPGDVKPILGFIDPHLGAGVLTDVNEIFKRFRFGPNLTVIDIAIKEY